MASHTWTWPAMAGLGRPWAWPVGARARPAGQLGRFDRPGLLAGQAGWAGRADLAGQAALAGHTKTVCWIALTLRSPSTAVHCPNQTYFILAGAPDEHKLAQSVARVSLRQSAPRGCTAACCQMYSQGSALGPRLASWSVRVSIIIKSHASRWTSLKPMQFLVVFAL